MTDVAIERAPNRLIAWANAVLPPVVPDAEPGSRNARRADVGLYVGATLIGTATLADTWSEHPVWLRVVAVAVGIGAVVALRWRRTHPAEVGIGIGVLSLVVLTVSGAALAATFNAAIRCRGRDLAIVAGISLTWSFVNPLLYPPPDYWFDVASSLAFAAILFGWGFFVRARRALVRTMTQQAERAGDEARAAERRRIAREMHDVLAHRLSLLSVHAGALEFHSGATPEEVAAGAGVIRENARIALEELRGVIGVLREDGSGETFTEPPQPTLADVADLVEESRAAGMRVSASINLGDEEPPAATGRTAYRIVQEGLTNARKHAPGASVSLAIGAADDQLQVEVRSLAAVAVGAATAIPGTETGLIGLAERVALAGGALEHGVDADGAFVLRASLPR